MHWLIKNAVLIDPASKYNGEKISIYIKNGKIDRLGKRLSVENAREYDAGGCRVSFGWTDVGTQVGDPGFEHREDFRTVAEAAAAGGFTAIACFPNTFPAIHSKSEVLYVKNHSDRSPVDFLPVGAVSENCKGKDITEMYDMKAAGAVAFSDGKNPIQDSGLMMRALQYVQPFNGVIINQPLDLNVAQNGQMHEGLHSTSLGLRGIPSMAEELIVQRDIYLADYTNSRLHVQNISTAESVRLIKEAKSRGLKVTSSVAALNLAFDHSVLQDFDSNFKVLPPLREKSDRQALIAGLKDGTIDCITSNHTPLEAEVKDLEFLYAKFGAIGLQTAFSLCLTALKDEVPLETLVAKLAYGPREVLGLETPAIKPGTQANLTIFNPDESWTLKRGDIRSKSYNTPLINRTFTGKVRAIFNNGKMVKAD